MSNYPERIITAINRILGTVRGQRIESHHDALFCLDDDVDYGSVWRISRSKLIPTAKLSEVLEQLAARGPGWIHANFVDTNESLPLITLRAGEGVGALVPSINISTEIGNVVEIIDP